MTHAIERQCFVVLIKTVTVAAASKPYPLPSIKLNLKILMPFHLPGLKYLHLIYAMRYPTPNPQTYTWQSDHLLFTATPNENRSNQVWQWYHPSQSNTGVHFKHPDQTTKAASPATLPFSHCHYAQSCRMLSSLGTAPPCTP